MSALPRVLFVGRGRYSLPLPGWLAKKWDAIEPQLDYRLLGAAGEGSAPSNERFRLSRPLRPRPLDAVLFHFLLPFRVRRQLKEFAPAAIIASDPLVGAAALAGRRLAGRRTPVIVEVHGDWRAFTRLYGSPARKLLAPFTDRVGVYGVRHADATRAVSTFTSELIQVVRGRPPSAVFAAFSDLSVFTDRPPAPLPALPTAVFVGALEPYKNIDGLAAAWRLIAGRVPEARLIIVGSGSRRHVVDALVAEFPERVVHHDWLEPAEVAAALDDATVLTLPSWPEGMGRVVVEAFARGRGVVATAGGGIPDLVTDGVEGLLIPRSDVPALAAGLERVLTDRELAERLGEAGLRRYADFHWTPEQLATELRQLVDRVVAGTAR
jgi:glycosyltransferase involved in cell wall biosynthesis